MYLKRIEMSGFKSFADRTVIDFEEGLTAIVGPNGSGKSNVTEAVRWVLGEQSAKNLRGDKMYDVIFSGSDKRKAMNICEVTIVLDNSDRTLPLEYDEVSVLRRLTRAGDSYYAINKKQCRLKDIVELFMDSGLGKHSFSIISQGKVEAIFDDKPENRRALFEETAGVLKYKQKKQKASQKLTQTEDNLERLDDIIYELKAQLGPLKEQVDTALEYQKLSDKYQELDLSVQVDSIKIAKEKYDELNAKLPDKKKVIDNSEFKLQNDRSSIQQKSEQLRELEQEVESLQSKQIKTVEEYEQKQALEQVTKERKQHQAKTKQELEQSILEETAQETELAAKIANEVTNNHDLEQKLKVIQNKIRSYQEDLKSLEEDTGASHAKLQEQYFNYMQDKATVHNERQYLEKRYQQEQARDKRKSAKEEQINANYQELEVKIKNLKEDISQQKTEQEKYDNEIETAKTTLLYEKEQLQKREEQKQQANSVYQQLLAKYKSLNDLQQNYHGFYQGVKAILQVKNQLQGIYDAVANCFKMDAKYTQAMEVAIGSAMQNIIVEDEKAAAIAINYLKKNKQGRATFLPLSIIKGSVLNETVKQKLLKLEGFIGLGIELIEFDNKYYQVMASLVGSTIVVDTLANANKISKEINYKYKVVTLDGEIIRPGGAMTGGNVKNNNGILAQQVELDELKQKLPEIKERLELIEDKRVKQLNNLAQIEESQKVLEAKKYDLAISLQNNEKLLAVKEEQFEQIGKEYQAMNFEARQLSEFFSTFDRDLKALIDKEEWLEREIQNVQKQMKQATQTKEEKQQKREYLLQEISQLEASKKYQKETVETQQKRIVELKSQKQKARAKIAKWKSQIEMMSKELSEAEIDEIKEQLTKLKVLKEEITAKLLKKKAKRDELKVDLERLEEKVNNDYEKLSNLKAEYQKELVAFEQVDQKLDQNLEYLQTEYQMTYDFAKEHAKELTITVSEAKLELQTLQGQIKSLGPVNMAALDQYQKLQERFEFMDTQRQDLIDAKMQLLKTMGAMDKKVKEKFKQTFEEIALKFSELFPKIFGGGRAALHLTDENDLLNTGIEIEAEPPGKKLQRLSLLSGGERSLTAITLLFAMIQVKPVPFCILDEVEAALDEANVYRFGSYLNHLDDKTQFIVITHRKGTMEAADILYGVTMQESGVSSLVSVKMDTLKEKIEN